MFKDGDRIITYVNGVMVIGYTAAFVGAAVSEIDKLSLLEPVAAVKVAQSIGSSTASMFIAQEFTNMVTGDVYQGPYRAPWLERPAWIAPDEREWPISWKLETT